MTNRPAEPHSAGIPLPPEVVEAMARRRHRALGPFAGDWDASGPYCKWMLDQAHADLTAALAHPAFAAWYTPTCSCGRQLSAGLCAVCDNDE